MKLSSRLLAMSLVIFSSNAAVTNVLAQTVFTSQQQIASNRQTLKPGINRITFTSVGEKLVGNLYLPTNYKSGDKLPTVIVSGSWTTVKEQMAGKYAQKLSERGYAALAFDSRSFGESGGKLRSVECDTY